MANYKQSRRLQKKLRVGEFTEYGFKLGFSLNEGLDDAAQNAFFDAFMGEGLEQKGLAFFGFDDNAGNIEGFVTLAKRGSVSDAQRGDFESWLKARGEVSKVVVGELKDANQAWA